MEYFIDGFLTGCELIKEFILVILLILCIIGPLILMAFLSFWCGFLYFITFPCAMGIGNYLDMI